MLKYQEIAAIVAHFSLHLNCASIGKGMINVLDHIADSLADVASLNDLLAMCSMSIMKMGGPDEIEGESDNDDFEEPIIDNATLLFGNLPWPYQ